MHPRYGLMTPYLSDEYMERVRTCVNEAKKQGIQAWIYDEHPWPSGGAGGLTAAYKKEYRHKALVMRMHNRLTPIDKDEAVAYYAVRLNANGIPTEFISIEDPENYHGRERCYLHFYLFTENLHQSNEPGFDDDNTMHGFATSDNMNPEAVRRFIDVTYGAFEKAVGGEFGTTLIGGFSDMPVYNWNYGNPHPCIPWTTGFEKQFLKEYGYDIISRLPSLFFDVGEDFMHVRLDYWKAVSTLFVNAYTKQLYEWCDQRGLIYTCHYWGEETLHWQIPWAGDVMHHFAYQHYVGMDHSIKNIEDPIGIKQAATVAEQLEKPRMVSETYGMSGNNITHKQRKWIADWEYALGTNFLVPYIAHSSLRGRRKRDEPASLFIQQPYWQDEKLLYDYYGRLSYALTRGKRKIDILVMQPLSTAQAMYQASNYITFCHRPDPRIFEAASVELYDYNQRWMDLCDSLLAKHRDFHIGNETLMEEYARVDGNRLVVGAYSYSVVVVPASITWSTSTVRLLRDFAVAGGKIIAIKPLPICVDGIEAACVLPNGTENIDDFDEALESALDKALAKDILMPNCGDILVQHRVNGAEDIYFLCNTSMKKSYLGVPILLPGEGFLEVWDAINGARFNLPCENRNGCLSFALDFYPVSSYLLVRKNAVDDALETWTPIPHVFRKEQTLSGEWEIALKDLNALVLDFCDLQIGEHRWQNIPVWKAHQYIKQSGLKQTFMLGFSFMVQQLPNTAFLVVETPERFEISINGNKLSANSGDWWVDPSFCKIDISQFCRVGKNEIEIQGRLGVDTEIENCVVIGEFSLKHESGYVLVEPRMRVSGEDITQEGYPFFTGRAILRKRFEAELAAGERAFISFDKLDATYVKVWVNGKLVGDLPWEPYTLEITRFLHSGTNALEVEIVSTRYNLFGPHHFKFGEEETFSVPDRWTNESLLTEEYFFTKLGVTGAKLAYL